MGRRLINLAVAVSLVLFLAIIVLWVRSYAASDYLIWQNVNGQRTLRTARGSVVLWLGVSARAGRPTEYDGVRYRRERSAPMWRYLAQAP